MKRTLTIGANSSNPITVNRFGYGTMRLTGEHVWGEPADRKEAIRILQKAIASGINFLDTADYYGDDVTNRLIAEALHPYNDDLVICTKVGTARKPDKSWIPYNKPAELRKSVEKNLTTLKIKHIPLVHFRVMPGSDTPLEESLEAMFAMQREGKIVHVGISNVSAAELTTAMKMGSIASVENAFGYSQRSTFKMYGTEIRGMQEVMDICTQNRIVMVPFWSLQNSLPKNDDKVSVIVNKYTATPAQINLAWLLHYHDMILPIPGTSKLSHFEENMGARDILLSAEDMRFLG